jgi:hypothetical protein
MSLYALNLFDLADNDDDLASSRRSLAAARKYGGTVVALGKLDADAQMPADRLTQTFAALADPTRRSISPASPRARPP